MPTITRSLQQNVPADPSAPSFVRHQLNTWLRALAWPRGHTEDLLMVASEAVTNAVEHAYRAPIIGWVQLTAEHLIDSYGTRRVVMSVTDQGRWRPPAPNEHRGHGLALIRALTDSLRIDTTSGGTSVTMTSYAVINRIPAPRAPSGIANA
jgi:anti-sigma regulatory factor (Ser/Thr protein kinase)